MMQKEENKNKGKTRINCQANMRQEMYKKHKAPRKRAFVMRM